MTTGDLIAIPYLLARIPLAVVDSAVIQRLPDDSRPRALFDRQLGSMDRLAGRLLRDEGVRPPDAG